MSWDESFASSYDVWAADMTADIPFYAELGREADGPLVELAVGTGRVAIPVALATGRPSSASTHRRRCSSMREPELPRRASSWICAWGICETSSSTSPPP